MSAADGRAALVAALDRTDPTEPVRDVTAVRNERTPLGFVSWQVGDSPVIVMPGPAEGAPPEFVARYRARVIANATGMCPLCLAAASMSFDPETDRRAYQFLHLVYAIKHEPDCPATFGEEDRDFFDPRADVR